MPIDWNEKLKTGLPDIDNQHQELVVMLTRLHRFKCGETDYQAALSDLQDYMDKHFKTEEECMVLLKYPQYDEHKFCHDKFIEDCKRLNDKKECTEITCNVGEELFEFVQAWILYHYSNEDLKLAEYIRANTREQ